MVVTTRGSIAWIWTATYEDRTESRCSGGAQARAGRDSDDKFGVILDSGPEIDLRSLERRGSTVSWVKAGARVSVPLR